MTTSSEDEPTPRPDDDVDEETLLGRHPSGSSVDDETRTVVTSPPGEAPSPTLGRVGAYDIEAEIGRGAQGTVFRARDPRLGRVVALKVLRSGGAVPRETMLRFRQEAALTAKLNHPGICAIHDVVIEPELSYICMQFVDGEPLSTRIATSRSAGVESRSSISLAGRTASNSEADRQADVVLMIEKAARALHVAHEAGIVHRDIKPGNIMVTPDGSPVVLDFGLAHDAEGEHHLTVTGDLVGTPAYMSPEQIGRGKTPVDRRTDVYSLGVTLYECLTMERPFSGHTREALFRQILEVEAGSPRRLNRAVSRDLEVVVATAMEKDPDRRYQTAAALADDLDRVRTGRPVAAKPVSAPGRVLRWAARRPGAAAMVALLVVTITVAAVVGGYLYANLGRIRQQEAAERQRTVEDRLQAAYRDLHETRRENAIAGFDAALAVDPECLEAVTGIALSHLHSTEPEKAIAVLDDHAALEGRHPSLGHVRLEALRMAGRDDRAAALEAEIEPATRAEDWFVLGYLDLVRAHVGDAVAAKRSITNLRRAIRTWRGEPRMLYYVSLARAAHEAADGATARDWADALITLWPQSSYAWYGRGIALVQFDAEESLAASLRSLELQPGFAHARSNVGFALMKLGRFDEALAEFDEALRCDPYHYLAHNNRGAVLVAQGRLDEAESSLRAALENNPRYFITLANLANAAIMRGALEASAGYLDQLEAVNPRSWYLHMYRARLDFMQSRFEDAESGFRRGLEIRPTTPEMHAFLGGTLAQLRRFDEAEEPFRRALELDPRCNLAYLHRGLMRSMQGRHDDAVADLEKAIELLPADFGSICLLAELHLRNGDHDEALDRYESCTEVNPSFATGWDGLGRCLLEFDRLEEAEAALRKAAELDESGLYTPSTRYQLGRLLLRMERPERAEAAFRSHLELHPDDGNSFYSLADALSRQRRNDEALAALDRCLELFPKYASAHDFVGILLRRKGRVADSIAALDRAIALGGKSSVDRKKKYLPGLRIERALDAYLEDDDLPDSTRLVAAMSKLAHQRALHRVAVDLGLEAFEVDVESIDLSTLYLMTLSAVAVAEDASVTGAERETARDHALAWLEAAVARVAARTTDSRRERLSAWLEDDRTAPVRLDEHLRNLPAERAAKWRATWKKIRELASP